MISFSLPLLFVSLFVGFIFTYLFLLLAIPFLTKWFLDSPNHRSSHSFCTPSGGGISFIFSFLFPFFFVDSSSFVPLKVFAVLFLILLPLSLISFLDDYHTVSPSIRFFIHGFTGIGVLTLSQLSVPHFSIFLIYPLLFFLFVGIVNFVNFMDGLDGLVAGSMLISLSGAFITLSVSWPYWVIIGSLFSFLLFNWSPSKVFMGDVGSTFLAAVFVAFILQSPTWYVFFGLLLIPTPLFADSIVTIVRRFFAQQDFFSAHRLHLYQRLHQSGWSHSLVALTYVSSTLLLCISFLIGGLSSVLLALFVVLILGLMLDKYFAIPFSIASSNSQ